MAQYQRTLTVQDTVSRVLGALGLPAPTSVFDSSDGTVIQMRTLLNDAGEELLTEHEWQILSREHQITTVPGQVEYDLPADFDRYITSSQWNYSTRLPMLGSVTTQQWQELKARQLGGLTISLIFQVDQGKLVLYSSPSEAQNIVLPYLSRAWVQDATGTLRDNATQNSDVILYDPALFRAKLQLDWMTNKGFDTTAINKKYNDLLTAAKNKDTPAQPLTLVPGGAVPLLGLANMPETGYGSAT